MAVDVDEVEQIEVDGHPRAAGPFGIGDVHPGLKSREAGDPFGEGHDLAVGDEVGTAPVLEPIDDLRVGRVQKVVRTRAQLDAVIAAERQATNAVQLALEEPVGVGEALIGELGLHRLQLRGPWAGTQLGQLL